MNNIGVTFVGLAEFMFKLIIALYLLRMLAVKLHNTAAGQGLAALVF